MAMHVQAHGEYTILRRNAQEARSNRLKMEEALIRIGISSCLLGQKVRFDAGHKRDRYVTDTLADYFEWVPVCPEVELGLGIPRETIHLIQILHWSTVTYLILTTLYLLTMALEQLLTYLSSLVIIMILMLMDSLELVLM